MSIKVPYGFKQTLNTNYRVIIIDNLQTSLTTSALNNVDSTITTTTGASATSVTDANGEVVYTFTVGTTTAAVAGTYTGIVSFDAPALGVKSTPTYKLTVGSDDIAFTEVLKSVVALIASINKQIQALQKLILKR